MATAAFKSSSRRGNHSSNHSSSSSRPSREESRCNAPIRRSRSVSVFSRGHSDISTEFLNKRDNPLFCSTTSPSRQAADETQSASAKPLLLDSDSQGAAGARGRHASRNGGVRGSTTGTKETGRSLSRMDTGRRLRSASQCPASRRRWSYSTSEIETECKDRNYLKSMGSNRKGGLFGSDDSALNQVRDLRRWSSQHSTTGASDCFAATLLQSGLETRKCEDAISTASSGYGSDLRTIKTVSERMKSELGDQQEAGDIYETVRSEVRRAISEIQNDLESAIHRSNPPAIAYTGMADIPPYSVNPDAEEVILEIRREYAKKLEESQERSRNLRENLAVEEHCAQELDKILKEVLPYPKTAIIHKSHPARKTSIERRRMSKRLAEDAKAYFDECVSLSTFDSSDFSSQEDPPLTSVGSPTPPGSYECLLEESGTQKQSMKIHYDIPQPGSSIDTFEAVHCQVSSINNWTETGRQPCFSFAQKTAENSGFQHDIKNYIKKFEKRESNSSTTRSSYFDVREYNYQSPAESLLIDRVVLKSRIEYGSLLLCAGGNILSSKSCGIGI